MLFHKILVIWKNTSTYLMALHTALPPALSHSVCHNSTMLLLYCLRTLQNTGNYQGVVAKDQSLRFLSSKMSCWITDIPSRKLWASIQFRSYIHSSVPLDWAWPWFLWSHIRCVTRLGWMVLKRSPNSIFPLMSGQLSRKSALKS